MATKRRGLASTKRVERAAGRISTAAVQRMGEEYAWFRDLSAEHRSWVGLVAQAGIAAFVDWLRRTDGTASRSVFGAAPRELARVISLQQAVDLVRITVDTVERAVEELAAPGEEAALQMEVLRFSREVAFAAAQVYATAAEERGAWHAMQQALFVEALLAGEPPDALQARATALGWSTPRMVIPLIGAAPDGEPEIIVQDAERTARAAGVEAIAGVHGDRLLLVVAADDPHDKRLEKLVAAFGKGPLVAGPASADVSGAGAALQEALAALRAAAAWPDAPRPVNADSLLPERALNGDPLARAALVEVYNNLLSAGPAVVGTVATYLESGCSVEGTARAMFLHPNTVRYRLRKAADVTHLATTDPREAFALRVALIMSRLAGGAP